MQSYYKLRMVYKILLPVSVTLVLGFGILAWQIQSKSAEIVSSIAKRELIALGWVYSSEMHMFIGLALQRSEELANYIAFLEETPYNTSLSRQQILALLEETRQSDRITAAGIALLPTPEDAQYVNTRGSDEHGQFYPYVTATGIVLIKDDYDSIYYLAAQRTKKPYITDPYFYPIDGKDVLMMTAASPIIVNNIFKGIILVDFELDFLAEMIETIKVYDTGNIAVVMPSGIIVAHKDSKLVFKNMFVLDRWSNNSDLQGAIKTGQPYMTIESNDGVESYFYFHPFKFSQSGQVMYFVMIAPVEEVMAAVDQLTKSTLIASIITLVVLLLIISIAVRTSVKPLAMLAGAADEVARGNFKAKVDTHTFGDELLALNNSLKCMVDALIENITKAEESAQAKSYFLANMSHEIRTPMNAILGLVHLLMQSDINAVQHEYLTKTENAAKALLRIINDILDFSKIEAGKLDMEKEVLYLDEVLQNVVDMACPGIGAKGLEYIVNVQPNTPTGLIGDQIRLLQILNNLVNNAIKFTERGQIVLKVEIVTESTEEVTLLFVVQDTGIGLTKQQSGALFSAFTQADTSTTRRYGGTGLGLVICKRMVELMGGTIWVESEYGCGSTFSFTAKFGLHNKSPKYISIAHMNFRILSALVIDDNLLALECLSTLLKAIGFKVETATTGHEALNILADCNQCGKHFDLVFIDWKMPGSNGIEITKRINQLIAPAELPVIIMVTAYNRDDVPEQTEQTGIRRVMTKPISPSALLAVLSDFFDQKFPAQGDGSLIKKGSEVEVVRDFVGTRILLVEDNEINQLVASRILEDAGLVIDIANNGREAVDMAKTGCYQLILMDIQMPIMDGLAATREIRSIPGLENLPILAMTAHAMAGDREICLKAGMNDHISKPINLNEMFSTVAKWLKKDH